MDSTTPLAVPDAQNTAQRSQKVSDNLMDDHKEVSGQDYSPELPTGKQLTDATTSVPAPTASKGQIENMGAQDVQTISGIEERRARMERADAEKSLKSRLIQKYGFSGDTAAKLSSKLYDSYQAQQELKINQLSANLEMQNKALRAQSAHAQAQEKLAGIDLTAEDAPKQIASVMKEAGPAVSGTPYFEDLMKLTETHYSHANQFGKAARATERYLSMEEQKQKQSQQQEMAGSGLGFLKSLDFEGDPEGALNQINEYAASDEYKSVAGTPAGRSLNASLNLARKQARQSKAQQFLLQNPDLEITGTNADGSYRTRRKPIVKADPNAAMMAAFTGKPLPATAGTPSASTAMPTSTEPSDSNALPEDEGLLQTDSGLFVPPANKSKPMTSTPPVSNAGVFPSGQIEIGGAKTRKPLSEIAPQ